MDEMIALLKTRIDPLTRELQLDAHQTTLLLRWLTSVDVTLKQQEVLVKNLKGLVERTK